MRAGSMECSFPKLFGYLLVSTYLTCVALWKVPCPVGDYGVRAVDECS